MKNKFVVVILVGFALHICGCKTTEPELPNISDSPPSFMSPQTLTDGELHSYILEYLVEEHGLIPERDGISLKITPFVIPPVNKTENTKKWREMWTTRLGDDSPRVFIIELSESFDDYTYFAIEMKPNSVLNFTPDKE